MQQYITQKMQKLMMIQQTQQMVGQKLQQTTAM